MSDRDEGNEMAEDASEPEFRLALLSERVVAFGIDAGLFCLGWLFTLALFSGTYSMTANPHVTILTAAWTALFIVYQAYASSDGRASIGKALLGLRVVGRDGNPLDLVTALVRSSAYLASSILGIGFAWALLDPERRCWHDYPAGSRVLSERVRTPLRLLAVRGLACATQFGRFFSSLLAQVVLILLPGQRRV